MDFVKKISNYLLSVGFEVQAVRVPLNSKEQIKMGVYSMINDKSKTIFNFLNNHFPVKYSKERKDKSIYFIFRESTGKSIEICVKPKSKETIKNMEFTYSDFDFSHYIIDILFSDSCITSPHIQNDSFSLTLDAGPNVHLLYPDDFIEILECNLMKVPYLKSIIRDNKLSSIID